MRVTRRAPGGVAAALLLAASVAAAGLVVTRAQAADAVAVPAKPGMAAAPPRPGTATVTAAPTANCPPDPAPLTAEEAVAGMSAATDSGFLWKATKDGRSVYLYGTIHIAQRAWMFPGPQVLAALKASDTVALELDPTDPDIVARLQRAIGSKPGAPALPADIAKRLRAQTIAACLAPTALDGLRPEMRAVTLEVMAGRKLGLQPAYGIDIFIAQLSHQLNRPIRSLETPESQSALLVSDDPRETARSVVEVLDELEGDDGARILARLAGAWHDGDLADMSAYADWCDCLKTDAERADFAKLIDARNPLMAERIVEWHAQGRSLFVAVGSLHMVGAIGLPALLRNKGFDVKRVAFDPR